MRLPASAAWSILLCLSACAPAPVIEAKTESMMEEHVKTIGQERRKEMMARIEKEATGIATGSGATNKAFVFYDPQCSYCSDLWRETQPLKNQVDFVWVPVATLGEDSAQLSASILEARDPARVLAAIEESMRISGNPIAVKSAPSDAALAKVTRNTELMSSLDPAAPIQATPLMYYRSASGRVDIIPGSMDAAALKLALRLR